MLKYHSPTSPLLLPSFCPPRLPVFFLSSSSPLSPLFLSSVFPRRYHGPHGDVELYQTSGKKEGLVMAEIKEAGTYKLCFANHQMGVTKRLTFAVHIGIKPAVKPMEHAKVEHVATLEEMVTGIDKQVDEVDSEQRYYLARMHRNHFTQTNTQSDVMWYTLLDGSVMLAVTFAQVYYVRHLIDTRSWV